jgi:hypothetical protein
MQVVSVVLYVVAFFAFLLEAANFQLWRVKWIGVGLACWLAAEHIAITAH